MFGLISKKNANSGVCGSLKGIMWSTASGLSESKEKNACGEPDGEFVGLLAWRSESVVVTSMSTSRSPPVNESVRSAVEALEPPGKTTCAR